MELAPQVGDHLTARVLLSNVRLAKRGLTFSNPPFTALFLGYEVHGHINVEGFLELRNVLAPQVDHERHVPRGVNGVANQVLVTFWIAPVRSCILHWTNDILLFSRTAT